MIRSITSGEIELVRVVALVLTALTSAVRTSWAAKEAMLVSLVVVTAEVAAVVL